MQHPNEFNWTHLTSVKDIQDQGGCGSCWAFASAAVLRAHSEIWMKDSRKFSVQQIISCTANPLECGGTGGCKGATAELAMDYVYQYGCRTEEEMPYAETESQCPHSLVEGDALATKKAENTLGMIGWTKLPENKLDPLKTALVQKGPVAVSISAAYSFNQYGGGVLDNCPQDATIDHAVALVGYGETTAVTASAALGGITTPSLKYWLLQNSWGTDWGEQGFIRMVRKDGQEESYCGWDNEPEIGSGCLGGPPKVWVCGTCGLLYDTVIPHFEDKSRLSTPKPLAARQSSFLQRNDPPMQQPPAFW
jgi:cathepsin L